MSIQCVLQIFEPIFDLIPIENQCNLFNLTTYIITKAESNSAHRGCKASE